MNEVQPVMVDADTIREIRQSVAALCAGFPGEYWRALDREKAYPTAFVNAITPPFEAQYAAYPAKPIRPSSEDTLIMRPSRCLSITGNTAWR